MPISFTCPSCEQVIKVSRKYAGKKGRCPKCTEPTRVPQIAVPLHDVISDDLPPFGSEESRQPLPEAPPVSAPPREGPQAPRKGTRRAERPERRGRSARKPKQGGSKALLLVPALMILLVGGVSVALYARLTAPPPTGDGGAGGGDTETDLETARQDMQRLLAGLDRLEALGTGGELEEVNSLRAVYDRLRENHAETFGGQLLDAGDRLVVQEDIARANASDTSAGGTASSDDPPPADPVGGWPTAGPGDRSEQLLDLLSAGCARLLRLSLRERGSPLRRGAEPYVARDLRNEVARRLDRAQAEGPSAVFELVTDPAWHGLLGPGGYAQLLELAASYQRDLGSDPRCRRLVERARAGGELAMAYQAALNRAELACRRGDLAGALDAVAPTAHKEDTWFAATREYLANPEVASLVEGLADSAGPSEETTAEETASGGSELGLALGWRERLGALLDEDESPPRTKGLESALAEALEEARLGWADAAAVVHDLSDARKALLKEEALALALERVERVYFEAGFARASGPATFGALAAWCKKRDRDAWGKQLEPFLRLVPKRDKREKARRKRALAYEAVQRFAATRLERLGSDLRELVAWMSSEGYATDAAKAEVAALVERVLEPGGAALSAAGLRAELSALEHTAATEDTRKLEKAFTRRLDQAARRSRKATATAVQTCLDAGESGLAFDLFAYALLLDPDDKQARKALGQVRAGGQWVRTHRARRLKAGFAWDPERAWVRTDLTSKYTGDRHFDLQRETWDTLSALNDRHASPDDPWVVETEHFEVHSTAPLQRVATVCELLEEFYLALFRLYEPFFTAGGAKGVFGSAEVLQGRLRVWVYKDEDQYRAHSQCPSGSAGFYSPDRGTSFFYDDGSDDWHVLRHETTHHVLAEASANERGDRHVWLSEGAAVFVEYALRRPDGVLTAGGIQDNAWVRAFAQGLPKGSELTVPQVVALQSSDQWDAADTGGYRAVGGVLHFLCHMDEGRYRADVVDMIRDAYNGRSVALETYVGLDAEAVEVFLRHFYEQRRGKR
jgi:hypothetical protein